jgi:glycosyltransferase involved in cell wall biosynthesis
MNVSASLPYRFSLIADTLGGKMKDKLIELVKYDYNKAKIVLLPFIYLANLYYVKQKPSKHLSFLSTVFRLNWPGTFHFCRTQIKKHFLVDDRNSLPQCVLEEFLNNIQGIDRYKKFLDDPSAMMPSIITVLAPAKENNKGVLVIAYSYYFLVFLKSFDFQKVAESYHIVLEPSWNGLCEDAVLAFACLTSPVFVMAYEERDYNFLMSLNTNIIPVRLSANWWINPDQFGVDNASERDIDVIMIAAWAKFKRHGKFFEALKEIKETGVQLKVALVGYPNDLVMADIERKAESYGIRDWLEFYEWISPSEVSSLLSRSKVNVLWSRFEGLNRAIIEGMCCNTPCIVRAGFNFGMEYPYINESTGKYATETSLSNDLMEIINRYNKFEPRAFIEKNHNCFIATEILADTISHYDESFNKNNLVAKTSELNGMKYICEQDKEHMQADYKYLASLIKNAV